MKKRIKAGRQTLVGIVIPYAWDGDGRVSAVSLSATDDQEYIIENGERFLSLTQKPIRAAGFVKSGQEMHRAIVIKTFEVLDSTTVADEPLDEMRP